MDHCRTTPRASKLPRPARIFSAHSATAYGPDRFVVGASLVAVALTHSNSRTVAPVLEDAHQFARVRLGLILSIDMDAYFRVASIAASGKGAYAFAV
jgi:hypothetical protein